MNPLELLNRTSIQYALEGRSIIDLDQLSFPTENAAIEFLQCYGFDWNLPEDRAEIESIRKEAITFILEELLNPDEQLPQTLANETNLPALMCLLSFSEDEEYRGWICALLRVMHTLSHSFSYLNERYGEEIREQIFARFSPYISDDNEQVFFAEIPLERLEFRRSKSRRSVTMKLLQKRENVAADIFDWIGLRFVTKNRFDILRVLQALREKNIIMFANIKPSRSKNSLIDIEKLRSFSELSTSFDSLEKQINDMPYPIEKNGHELNPYSEESYHAIQFTCRQRIKIKTNELERYSFFFPFEIQLTDCNSYEESRSGRASHQEYKTRQKRAVRKRILPHLK
ncbi:TIGR04552 family protein [Aliikangiella sp. G2MR2-5]|uniref:TIGR04552 family protein n=1 Tax=Aliikangiella sp. G2MR2-5 TaxID=2788943 RepID=UPI0018A8E066|nr:TIGR04552 family protein [Aliikangiella sp. G2MR2-5]